MDRRIFGLENEYGVTCTFRGQRRLSPDEVARYLFRRVVSWGRSSNVFLRNGARLYLDVGSHPEYATPECDNLIDLVTHDKAGERILEGLLVDADRRLREEGIAGDIYLFKNNTDSAGNSYGCHENYLVGRHGEFGRLADILIPFLVTRQIICGAGKVLQTPRGAVYCVSQRAEHIWEGVSSATTRSRPIINTRDEPHADAERFRRLHVIVGDSNMSETTMLLKVGATDLVLRMVEAGTVMRDLTLENPIRAIRDVSHDMTGRRKVRLANGREVSALDIQQEYLSKARDFADRRGPDPITERVLALWELTLRAVQSGDLGLVAREIDWVTKYQLIERYRAKHDLQLSHPRVAQLDLAYHDVHRGRGLYYLLQRRGAVERVCRDLDIFQAKIGAAADHQGPAARGVHPAGAGAAPRLHGGLGAPEAERPGAADRALQGPVPLRRRARGEADRRHVRDRTGRSDVGFGTRRRRVSRRRRRTHRAAPQPQPARLPRWAGPALFAAAAVVAFACYLRMSLTVATNSDGASNALQAWDMLHGNLLLHGWWLSDVSFYTTELPEYMLVELAHGLNADVVHIGAALSYTLLTALAALLAKGRATGREAWVRMLIAAGLMLAPQLGVGTQVLLLSPDHVGTMVPVLAAWLLLDRFGRRWWVPVAVGLLLAWTLVADAIVVYIGIVPLLAVGLIRAYHEIVQEGRRPAEAWYELSLAGAALAALVVGLKVPSLIHAMGGYSIVPAPQSFAQIRAMAGQTWLVGAGLLLLFGGDFFGLRFGLHTGLVLLHLVGVAVAAWAVWAAARRFLRDSDLVAELLVIGTLIIVVAYLFSQQALGIGYSHEMAPGPAVRGGAGRQAARWPADLRPPGPCGGGRFARLRAHPGQQRPGTARAVRGPPARIVPGRAPPALRPERLLAGRRADAGQREPGPDQGAAGEPGQRRRQPLGVGRFLVRPAAARRQLRAAVRREARVRRRGRAAARSTRSVRSRPRSGARRRPTTSAATGSWSGARTCCAAFPERRRGAGNGAGRLAALMTRLRGFSCDASLLRSCYP